MKTKDGFVRDNYNIGAVLNTDNEALKAYKLQKKKNKEVNDLKNEVKELKGLMYQILEKLNK